MASPWYDVAHSSVRVTLRCGDAEKALDLSPVILGRYSAFFTARYPPGGNDWKPAVLEVESIEIAETLFRAFYDPDAWSDEIFEEWRDHPALWRLMDLLQVRDDLVKKALGYAKRTIDRIEGLAELVDGSFADAPLAATIVEDVASARALSFGRSAGLDEVAASAMRLFGKMHGSIRIFGGTRGANLRIALRNFSATARVEMLFDVVRREDVFGVGDSDRAAEIVGEAVIMIAEDLRDAKEDRDAAPYLEAMTREGSLGCRWLSAREAMLILREIRGDEVAGSIRLRARDKLALLMNGVVFGGARKRGREE